MIKKIFGTGVGAVVLTVAGKMVSDFAETKPSLKNVKDKLKKTGKDFTADCKDVLLYTLKCHFTTLLLLYVAVKYSKSKIIV